MNNRDLKLVKLFGDIKLGTSMFKFIKLMGALPSEGWWVNHNNSDQGLLNRFSQYEA